MSILCKIGRKAANMLGKGLKINMNIIDACRMKLGGGLHPEGMTCL
jgi:hypothetical protein